MSKRKNAAAEITHTAAKAGEDALNKIGPYVEQARDQIAPKIDEAIGSARERLDKDILPRLNEVLKDASEHPAAEEARKRSQAAAAALRGELSLPEPKRKRKVFLPLLLVLLTAGLGYLAWKKLAGDKDEWETYGNTSWNPSDDFSVKDDSTSQSFSEPVDVPEAAGQDAPAAGSAGPDAASTYGPGSYVGDEPPVGHTIKGNARSMKYHTPDSGGYERTIADVWFTDEDAAQRAGFTRAQR
ncbi:hypothetical protein GGQ54_002604 [Naumannella cuiyingiana]|uniref:Uncharacterized protein n=1 Tax=Naumannella cuiyingiana TaxID=1347891 RepID=A0A7Z0DAL4_9ACTN|nr:hypothetical protein [Naumannella cuiyingiana]